MSLRVAVVGGGPAGIYAADILTKSDVDVTLDIIERLGQTTFSAIRQAKPHQFSVWRELIRGECGADLIGR